jgi:hypothetical protein
MRFKVGLSAVSGQTDVQGHMWTNGMTQNLVYLALLLQRLRNVAQVYIVPFPDATIPHQPSVVFGFKQLSLSDAVQELDVLIEVGMRIPNEDVARLRARGGKIVSYVAGNSFVMSLEAVVNQLHDRGEVLPDEPFDATWITPQHWHTNRDYSRLTRAAQVYQVNQIWDPIVLRHALTTINHHFFYKRRLHRGVSVGVFEPNINVVKTFHFPVLLTDMLYRRERDAVHHIFTTNTYHLKDNPHLLEFYQSLDVFPVGKITVESRFPVYQLLGQHVDTVVVHHWENGLNYLYYDALYGGYPLVHNSEFLREVGYYYNAFDVEDGARALERAWLSHDDNFGRYQEQAHEVLWRVNPDNGQLQRQHELLLEALFDGAPS